jgi:hypothetical protein
MLRCAFAGAAVSGAAGAAARASAAGSASDIPGYVTDTVRSQQGYKKPYKNLSCIHAETSL